MIFKKVYDNLNLNSNMVDDNVKNILNGNSVVRKLILEGTDEYEAKAIVLSMMICIGLGID